MSASGPSARTGFPLGRLTHVFAALLGSHVGGAVFGLIFWILAAHSFTAAQVGLGAALVAAMTLLAELSLLGVDTLLLERFKSAPVAARWPLLSAGLTVVAGTGLIVALAGFLLLRVVRPDGVMGSLSLRDGVLLMVATVVAAVCSVFDQAAVGMGAGAVQLRRNLSASVLRTGVLGGAAVLGLSNGNVILVAWIVGMAGSLLTSRLPHEALPRSVVRTGERWQLIRTHGATALGHHGLTLAMGSSALLLPVVVGALIPAEETAYFVQARLLSDTALALPFLLTIALFATAADLGEFRRTARYTVAFGVTFTVCLIGGAALLGHWLLLMFGPQYAKASLPLLLLLLATGPVLVIKDHFVVLRRLQGKRVSGAVVMMVWAALELSGAVAGGLTGNVTSVCVGWLAMSTTCSLLALPLLINAIRPDRGATAGGGSESEAPAEQTLAQFWTAYAESGTDRYRYAACHPLQCLQAYRAVTSLPITFLRSVSDNPGGLAVRGVLELKGPFGVPARWLGSAVLAVPQDPAEHLRGPHAQTLRRKIRAAERRGIRCRAVRSDERPTLVKLCNAVERSHHDERYRVANPHNDDLLQHDLWMIAEDAAGRPLLLVVLPVDAEVATLRYFRTLGTGEDYSLSRYLGTHAAVAELASRGVRWLLDTAPPGAQTNGIRHFQRMVGFRYVRLRVRSRLRGPLGLPEPVDDVRLDRGGALTGASAQ